MNSFFASVEQQLDPQIRGKPVAITAMEGMHGSCVAASYEAKAFGVKTGTSVRDAKRLCPGIVFLPSRHRLYVRYNLRVAEVLDRYAELERIRSVDEFQLGLSGVTTSLEGAFDLVRILKTKVAEEVGECLRFSAGIGPNHLLAKIAGKLEKPDGCQWLGPDNMPERIAHLALDDLPGISKAMRGRLEAAGVNDMLALCRLDPRHARVIWNSVEGERFVRSLQGEAITLTETQKGGFGNSKILAPEFRNPQSAYLVSRWLVEKATARMRRDGWVAGSYSLQISIHNGPGWHRTMTCPQSQDTAYFHRINRAMWRHLWRKGILKLGPIMAIGVNLGHVERLDRRNGDFLRGLRSGQQTRGERIATAVDFLNARLGQGTVTWGVNQPHPGFFERG
ncbi:DNA polymerase Y family protein [Cypionkella psychrotolerans]|uniref:DNA polymerase Y family protein n=1 Tax=Cypionkella psychrotolerans TaxID=1678131 RepID=UPI001F37594B|nr:UMUC-like DNA-repair protein [Cypionkella psychrotolerans]